MVLRTFPRDPAIGNEYDTPAGDPGWFGPDSVTWRVHADFAGMLAGGLSALYLQTLHPRALAGVWDHSDFRHDLLGRLRRTTAFVAGTTFANTDSANRLTARVRAIHARVRGVDEHGTAYAADDPALLTWVHVTEVWSFLEGHRRYGPMPAPAPEADRYFAETARIAEALGARDVPRSASEVSTYLDEIQPVLRFGERSRAVLTVLEGVSLPVPLPGLARGLFLGAGAALLPSWAERLMERSIAQRRAASAAALALKGLAPVLRAALHDGLAARAMRRCGRNPAELAHWPARPPDSIVVNAPIHDTAR